VDAEGYRLESLLKLRRREEEEAQRSVASAETAVAEARAREGSAAHELQRCLGIQRESRDRIAGAGLRSAAQALAADRWSERCARDAEAARAVLEEARATVEAAIAAADEARERLRERARAREAIEQHRARWEEERRREAERRGEAILDEAATAAHARREGEGS
jgi:flagellar biosynthesis chaperone FliJ